jgi:two-component system, response regulator PdtaR
MLPAPEPQRAPARILVVEDEVLVRIVLADELRDAGFAVIEAASAEEALSCLAAGVEVDLVFSDIRLTGSLSGLDLANQLRNQYASLPVMLTSGDYRSDPGPPGAESVRRFIPKPYNISHLISDMRDALGLKPSGGAP